MKFQTKATPPAMIDAIQYLGVMNLPKVLNFILDGHKDYSHIPVNLAFAKRGICFKAATSQIEIPTLDGVAIADVLDMIVRDANGKFFPMKPETFVEQYDDVPAIETTAVPE